MVMSQNKKETSNQPYYTLNAGSNLTEKDRVAYAQIQMFSNNAIKCGSTENKQLPILDLTLNHRQSFLDQNSMNTIRFQQDAKGLSVDDNMLKTVENAFPFDAVEAYKIRLQAFANGAIYVIKLLNVDDEHKNEVIDKIKTLTNTKINALETEKIQKIGYKQQGKILFYKLEQFNNELAKTSGLTRKDIALGEAFWAWQVHDRPTVRTTVSSLNKVIIIQQDKLLRSPLTDAQKDELLLIHQDKQPEWFLKLPVWAQEKLKSIVPTEKESSEAWENYQKTIPATLRHIPGQSNATEHTLTIIKQDGTVTQSTSYKQGVPSSFEMPTENTAKSAKDNLAQMLNDLEAKRRTNFNQYWGIEPGNLTTLNPPILLGGLLTPKEQGGIVSNLLDRTGLSGKENNSRFTDEKSDALNDYSASHNQNMFDNAGKNIFDLNVAINNQRRASPVKVNQTFIKAVREIMEGIKVEPSLLLPFSEPLFGEKLQKRTNKIDILDKAIETLNKHDDAKELPGRNKNLHLAALYDLTTRLAGGISTGNCKSSKDRKGVETMMADAMEIYYATYGDFPNHNDQGDNRKNFIAIFVHLYNTGHQLLLAHDNSPGSAGIKDEGILDKDIKEALGDSYAESKAIANFNKPQNFFDKHQKPIERGMRYFALACGLIGAVVTVALLGSGVLAPLAIIPSIASIYAIGGAPAVLGTMVTFDIAAIYVASQIGTMLGTALGGLAYMGIKRYSDREKEANTLEAQERLQAAKHSTDSSIIPHNTLQDSGNKSENNPSIQDVISQEMKGKITKIVIETEYGVINKNPTSYYDLTLSSKARTVNVNSSQSDDTMTDAPNDDKSSNSNKINNTIENEGNIFKSLYTQFINSGTVPTTTKESQIAKESSSIGMIREQIRAFTEPHLTGFSDGSSTKTGETMTETQNNSPLIKAEIHKIRNNSAENTADKDAKSNKNKESSIKISP